MRKGCRNNYIEVFGAVYRGKKKLFKKCEGIATTPSSEDEVKSLNMFHIQFDTPSQLAHVYATTSLLSCVVVITCGSYKLFAR